MLMQPTSDLAISQADQIAAAKARAAAAEFDSMIITDADGVRSIRTSGPPCPTPLDLHPVDLRPYLADWNPWVRIHELERQQDLLREHLGGDPNHPRVLAMGEHIQKLSARLNFVQTELLDKLPPPGTQMAKIHNSSQGILAALDQNARQHESSLSVKESEMQNNHWATTKARTPYQAALDGGWDPSSIRPEQRRVPIGMPTTGYPDSRAPGGYVPAGPRDPSVHVAAPGGIPSHITPGHNMHANTMGFPNYNGQGPIPNIPFNITGPTAFDQAVVVQTHQGEMTVSPHQMITFPCTVVRLATAHNTISAGHQHHGGWGGHPHQPHGQYGGHRHQFGGYGVSTHPAHNGGWGAPPAPQRTFSGDTGLINNRAGSTEAAQSSIWGGHWATEETTPPAPAPAPAAKPVRAGSFVTSDDDVFADPVRPGRGISANPSGRLESFLSNHLNGGYEDTPVAKSITIIRDGKELTADELSALQPTAEQQKVIDSISAAPAAPAPATERYTDAVKRLGAGTAAEVLSIWESKDHVMAAPVYDEYRYWFEANSSSFMADLAKQIEPGEMRFEFLRLNSPDGEVVGEEWFNGAVMSRRDFAEKVRSLLPTIKDGVLSTDMLHVCWSNLQHMGWGALKQVSDYAYGDTESNLPKSDREYLCSLEQDIWQAHLHLHAHGLVVVRLPESGSAAIVYVNCKESGEAIKRREYLDACLKYEWDLCAMPVELFESSDARVDAIVRYTNHYTTEYRTGNSSGAEEAREVFGNHIASVLTDVSERDGRIAALNDTVARLRTELTEAKDGLVRFEKEAAKAPVVDSRAAGVAAAAAQRKDERILELEASLQASRKEAGDLRASLRDLNSKCSPGAESLVSGLLEDIREALGLDHTGSVIPPVVPPEATVTAGEYANPKAMLQDLRETKAKYMSLMMYVGQLVNASGLHRTINLDPFRLTSDMAAYRETLVDTTSDFQLIDPAKVQDGGVTSYEQLSELQQSLIASARASDDMIDTLSNHREAMLSLASEITAGCCQLAMVDEYERTGEFPSELEGYSDEDYGMIRAYAESTVRAIEDDIDRPLSKVVGMKLVNLEAMAPSPEVEAEVEVEQSVSDDTAAIDWDEEQNPCDAPGALIEPSPVIDIERGDVNGIPLVRYMQTNGKWGPSFDTGDWAAEVMEFVDWTRFPEPAVSVHEGRQVYQLGGVAGETRSECLVTAFKLTLGAMEYQRLYERELDVDLTPTEIIRSRKLWSKIRAKIEAMFELAGYDEESRNRAQSPSGKAQG